jgi:hypothetical protein
MQNDDRQKNYLTCFFPITYTTRLPERYEDNLLTHPELDLDLWLETRSSGEPDRNLVYGISNITTKDMQMGCSVSTIGSSQSGSSS